MKSGPLRAGTHGSGIACTAPAAMVAVIGDVSAPWTVTVTDVACGFDTATAKSNLLRTGFNVTVGQ